MKYNSGMLELLTALFALEAFAEIKPYEVNEEFIEEYNDMYEAFLGYEYTETLTLGITRLVFALPEFMDIETIGHVSGLLVLNFTELSNPNEALAKEYFKNAVFDIGMGFSILRDSVRQVFFYTDVNDVCGIIGVWEDEPPFEKRLNFISYQS